MMSEDIKEIEIVEVDVIEDIPLDASDDTTPKPELVAAIEASRDSFYSEAKKRQKVNRIIFGILIVLVLAIFGAYIGLSYFGVISGGEETSWIMWVVFGGVIGLLGLTFLYVQLKKRSLKKKQNTYITGLLNMFGEYLYKGNGYSGYLLNINETYTTENFNESLIYQGISRAHSRAIYSVAYDKLRYRVAETVADMPSSKPKALFGKKETITAFLGRYFVAPNNLAVSRPIYVYIKGNADVISYPTEVDSLRLLESTAKYDILGEQADKKLLKKKLLDLCRKFVIDDITYDVTFAFHPGKTYVTISYANPAMDFPYENPFDGLYIKREMKDELIIRDILAIANE